MQKTDDKDSERTRGKVVVQWRGDGDDGGVGGVGVAYLTDK